MTTIPTQKTGQRAQASLTARIDGAAPPRLELAHCPTPLQRMSRIGRELGVDLWVKRDDLTGSELSGNKIRKLEYVLADAVDKGADTVLTCGGVQSNHCRATALAAARLGLACTLLLRVDDPVSPPPLEANSLLDRLSGARIVWVSREEYRQRDSIFAREAGFLEKAGRRPYIIPEGASNAVGAWGYARAMAELADDIARLNEAGHKHTTVLHATGSGGTGAGLVMGKLLLGLDVRVAGVNVCDDREYFIRVSGDICREFIDRYHLDIAFDRERDLEIIDGYVGAGYAVSRREELELIARVCRTEGIVLDPVYTGKAFYGMVQELAADPKAFGERIVFLHTGGLFGLFPKAGELRERI
ncbi:MAG: D-cysteine desulfhydrase family protein [Desulfobacterales bacterium]